MMNRQSQPSATTGRQQGSIVVYLALALVAFGVLAMAGGTRFSSSILSVSTPNCAAQARMMAESGVRYATARLRTAADQAALTAMITALNGQTYTVNAAQGQTFTLTVTAAGTGAATVSATGTACGGGMVLATTSASASATGGVNVPAASGGGTTPEIGQGDLVGNPAIVTLGGSNPVTFSGQTIFMGVIGQTETSAAIWYAGNSTNCLDGRCTMNYGLRSYFELQWDTSSTADGLVFGVMSAVTNALTSLGGDRAMGELMGWGGRGPVTGVDGIRPPKIGLEFDTWRNNANTPVYNSDSRADRDFTGNNNRNSDHMAFVFWGSNTSQTFTRSGTSITSTTYDDNRHASDASGSAGTGTSSDPISYLPLSGSGDGRWGYYYNATNDDWIKDGTLHKVRYELTRHGSLPNAAGNYPYILKAWRRTGSVESAYQNVNANYTAMTPHLYRVVFLSPALNTQLATIIFGFTEATGGATQKVALTNFKLSLKSSAETPSMPQDYVSYWPMNDNSGTGVNDANATNNNDGTLSGGASQWYNPGGSCTRCPAIRFTGANNAHVHVADAGSLDLTTQGSITAWFNLMDYVDGTHNAAGLVHKGDNTVGFGDEAYSLQFSGARVLILYIKGTRSNGAAGEVQVDTPQIPFDTNWHHVAATWDSTELLIYIDGVLQGRTANTNGVRAQNSAGGLNIGSQGDAQANNYPFKGPLARVALYNRVLTAVEIAEMAVAP